MRRTTARWIALAVLGGTALSACSSGNDDGDKDDGSDPLVVEVTFEDGEVDPNGERVEVDAGRPIDLVVTADEPGEIHIHSDPEQALEYDAGTETFEIQIDRPGVVEVESHNLDEIIVQLEVQ